MVIAKVEFTHVIDSHHNPSSGSAPPASDVGDFTQLSNGDDFETGVMPNPDADNKPMAYEEVWHVLDWKLAKPCANFVLESSSEGNSGDTSTRTFYARVGRYFLAVRQTLRADSVDFAAVRQDWDDESHSWRDRYCIGDVASIWRMSDENINEHEMLRWQVNGKVVVRGDSTCVVKAVSLK